MKNIHILPTDKPSRLFLKENTLLLNNQYTLQKIFTKGKCQNIYVTSDSEIKEGDWHLNIVTNKISKYNIGLLNPNRSNYKKIILTDNQDLIKDGVQAIDDTFLEWFVENPSCKEVEVEPDYDEIRGDYYKIIIPQETLEEAADYYSSSPLYRTESPRQDIKRGFELGAKWQTERMYSEEDMTNYAMFILLNKLITPKEWFEQFKKK